jgi:exosortase family protein XrtG
VVGAEEDNVAAALAFVVVLIAWLIAVAFFRRARAWLPYYVIAAAGSAILLVVAAREFVPLESVLRQATAGSVHLLAPLLGIQTSLEQVDAGSLMVIGVPHHNEWTVLSVGLESSGLLELAALFGLVAFFPASGSFSRISTIAVALALTFAANVLRVLIIVATVAYFGQAYLDFAHIVLGRIVFFVIAIGIFWFAITRPTLQRVNRRLAETTL